MRRARTQAARDAAHAQLATCETALATLAGQAAVCAKAAEDQAAGLPALRESHGHSRTALERCRIALEHIEGEQAAADAALAEVQGALGRVERDRRHADQLGREAAQAEQRLAAEAGELADQAAHHPDRASAAEAALCVCVDALRDVDSLMHEATTTLAALVERRQALADVRAAVDARAEQLERAWRGLAQDRENLQPIDPAQLDGATAAFAQAELHVQRAAAALEIGETGRVTAAAAHHATRSRLHQTEPERARLQAEQRALTDILAVHAPTQATPLVDLLSVPDGLEAAIGAVLGELLELATEPDASTYLRTLPPLEPRPALPDGVAPLEALVRVPPILARALSQVGLVEPGDVAARLPAGPCRRPGAGGAGWGRLALGRVRAAGRDANPSRGATATAQSAGRAAGRADGGRSCPYKRVCCQ